MAKKHALLVRERQEEALRVAVGLTLSEEPVEVYVLDRRLAPSPQNAAMIEVLGELGMRVATNCAENAGLELLSNAELARRILACDTILPY